MREIANFKLQQKIFQIFYYTKGAVLKEVWSETKSASLWLFCRQNLQNSVNALQQRNIAMIELHNVLGQGLELLEYLKYFIWLSFAILTKTLWKYTCFPHEFTIDPCLPISMKHYQAIYNLFWGFWLLVCLVCKFCAENWLFLKLLFEFSAWNLCRMEGSHCAPQNRELAVRVQADWRLVFAGLLPSTTS